MNSNQKPLARVIGNLRKNTLLLAVATAAVFMTSFTAISPAATIIQTAAAVALPTGQWEVHANGYVGMLRVNSIDADGVVTGTLDITGEASHSVTGLYNERTGTLTFYRIINPQDPSSIQTYVGIVFRDGSPFAGTPDRLAGYFIGLPAGGGNKDQNVWGWYAILTSSGQNATSGGSSATTAGGNNTSAAPSPPMPPSGAAAGPTGLNPQTGAPPGEPTPPSEAGGANSTGAAETKMLEPPAGGENQTGEAASGQGGESFFGQSSTSAATPPP